MLFLQSYTSRHVLKHLATGADKACCTYDRISF